jgi:hypothetical protein
MAAKKNYYKQKLNEKRTQILLQIIEEEVDTAFKQLIEQYDDYTSSDGGEGKGLGRIVNRHNAVGVFLSPFSDIWNAVKFRTGELGIKAVKTVGELVANTITGLLPFASYDKSTINHYFAHWEDKALSSLDQQFAKERKEMHEGWNTFKTDFWGIGFVASPMSAIAGLAAGGKTLDAAFSVLNVVSGGRAERVYNLVSGERMRGNVFEAAETEAKKPFKDLPEDEKKKVLDQIMKNPDVVSAANEWSTKNLPKVMNSIVHDMNQTIASGKVGNVTPQEIANYKAMAPSFATTMFDKIKGKNKKFEVKPSPEALAATNQAVAAEIKSMPDTVVQPQQPNQ